jgi:nucleotide-binding universal stress UspA family protein
MSNENEQQFDGIRIVVGVDFTDTGNQALSYGVRIAKPEDGSRLDLVYVMPEDTADSGKDVEAMNHAISDGYKRLRDHFIGHCAHAFPESSWEQAVTFHVRLGPPARAIHQVAVDMDADLIVVGTHGRKGVERFVLGSVAEKLVGIAQLPVLVAREKTIASLPKSDWPEPARQGENLQRPRGWSQSELIGVNTGRSTRISGLL